MCALLLPGGAPWAQPPPPAPRPAQLALSLREAISLALSKNFDILIESFVPRIRETDVVREESVFDPAATADLVAQKDIAQSPSRFFPGGVSRSGEQKVTLGFEQRVVSGAQYRLALEGLRVTTNSGNVLFDPRFEGNLVLTLTQPLLKDFGVDVNRAQIRIAQLSRDQSLLAYRARVIEVLSLVQGAYWELVFAIEDLATKRKSLELAKDLLRRNRIQVEVGTLAPIEILQAEAAVASREEDVIVAENAVRDAEDRLKRILNLPGGLRDWETRILPTDKPQFRPEPVNLRESIRTALRARPDYRQLRLRVQSQRIQLQRARNQTLPQLNLLASAGLTGLDNTRRGAADRLSSGDFYSWEVGVGFRIPLGNRAARSGLTRRRLEALQAALELRNLEQKVIEEVRAGVRRLVRDEKRVAATRVARRLAEKQLDAQEKKFSVGLSTSREVLEDQEALATALIGEVNAIVDYNKSLVNLARVTSTALEKHRVVLEDPRKRPLVGP
ncbi:MAG: TolC family protein [Nitrospinota bacterium]